MATFENRTHPRTGNRSIEIILKVVFAIEVSEVSPILKKCLAE